MKPNFTSYLTCFLLLSCFSQAQNRIPPTAFCQMLSGSPLFNEGGSALFTNPSALEPIHTFSFGANLNYPLSLPELKSNSFGFALSDKKQWIGGIAVDLKNSNRFQQSSLFYSLARKWGNLYTGVQIRQDWIRADEIYINNHYIGLGFRWEIHQKWRTESFLFDLGVTEQDRKSSYPTFSHGIRFSPNTVWSTSLEIQFSQLLGLSPSLACTLKPNHEWQFISSFRPDRKETGFGIIWKRKQIQILATTHFQDLLGFTQASTLLISL